MTYHDLQSRLAATGYVASDQLAMALHLALSLGRPLLLEGEAGVGKTEIARALAEVLDARLIRLQCYEGLDAAQAIYEWNYQRQLLAIRAHEGEDTDAVEERLFGEKYLHRRPLLEAWRSTDIQSPRRRLERRRVPRPADAGRRGRQPVAGRPS